MLTKLDLTLVIIYAVCIFVLAQWVSRSRTGAAKTSNDGCV
jgi:hypothetical protein